MSVALRSINGILKSKCVPPRWRHVLRKSYLLNAAHRRTILDAEITSDAYGEMLDVWKIIMHEHGYMRAGIKRESVDAGGRPIPWLTYPAIEFLSKLDFTEKTVFEYGAGNSTLWWSQRAKSITSVEGVRSWYGVVRARLPSNCRIIYEAKHERQIAAVGNTGEAYDVIVVDGLTQNRGRLRCCMEAVKHLRPGGMIILDNSDHLPMSTQFLRESGLIESDFSGLAPLSSWAATTSVFFTRDFDIQPKSQGHPGRAIGGVEENWEDANHKNQVAPEPEEDEV